MASKELKIRYEEFTSPSEMTERDRMLVAAALDAQKGSYSPYSQFQVGAALLLSDGTVVKGANQENAAYPSGLCAERTAMFAASANYPDVPMVALAIAGSDHGVLCNSPATPCGSCRQVMAQYQKKYNHKIEVILVGKKKIMKFGKVEDILPFVFSSLD
ncbi:MAG: cytidine deaminase [Bacteroidales bacterium]|nr:cytidine deaminase [Bacteroidales bacterium]